MKRQFKQWRSTIETNIKKIHNNLSLKHYNTTKTTTYVVGLIRNMVLNATFKTI